MLAHPSPQTSSPRRRGPRPQSREGVLPASLNPTAPNHSASGQVTFLGAGPGDPGLLTLRAVEALASADVLIADPQVLDVVRVHARAQVGHVDVDFYDRFYRPEALPETVRARTAELLRQQSRTT